MGVRCNLSLWIVGALVRVTPASLVGGAARASTGTGGDQSQRRYTQNTMCFKKNCINPVFPGLFQISQANGSSESTFIALEQETWQCAASHQAWKLTGICDQVTIGYKFALPLAVGGSVVSSEADIIKQQSKKAMSTYAAHISGMGKDLWDYTAPWEQDDCIQSIWKMACYTHFPRCSSEDETKYLRPCKSSCQNYIRNCAVECCDEGTQCVFEHNKQYADGTTERSIGYVDHDGPSPQCTGGAVSQSHTAVWLFALVLGAAVPPRSPQS